MRSHGGTQGVLFFVGKQNNTLGLTKVVKEKKVPFELTYNEDPFYSESNMKSLDEATRQFKNSQIVTKTMEELEAIANG